MRIGVIGIGMVGGTLGSRWARGGHEVLFGVREPSSEKVGRLLADSGENARAGTVAEAAAFGEVVALATPWGGTEDALRHAGDLSGKVLLDCTNPLKPDLSGLEGDRSAAEQVAAWAPGAKVVKIFNTTGANNMDDPRFGDDRATMFYCGDDAEAKKVAARLAEDLGFEAGDAGPLAEARSLEHLALLWIHLAYVQKLGRGIAFKLMRR
ncbi:MAG: NADPH-dependent F420 reductase [Thermoanaerobaculia bacterium]